MNNKLNYENNFVPCFANEGDEIFANGIFEFNISKMIEYVESHETEFEITELRVSDYYRGFSGVNESHVDSVILEQPVIIAEISPNRFNLIDGNHRVEKARRNNIQTLPCYRLNVAQHYRFLTSERAYKVYVEYWNEKLSERDKQ
jgi:hypothetical protein